jgi:hypothetical protein
MTAVNYTGLIPQLPPLLRVRPQTQAEWEQFLQQLNVWQQLLLTLAGVYQSGVVGPVTITTAKLTTATGSMTFTNGVLTAETAAT